ncbi:MAG: phosphatidate cytidylyltransferase [Oscillospiraceae bacterium]|nr:phosphatidate cytidylyltransferase [Oscillospiraceae bacterium]
MARRIVSAFVAIPIGIIILWLDRKEVILVAVSAFSVMAVYEVLLATKYLQNRSVACVSLIFVLTIPFVLNYDIAFLNTGYISFAFIIALFMIMLFNYKKVKLAEVSLVGFVSICIPFSLSCVAFLFDYVTRTPEIDSVHRTFCLVYALSIPFLNDSGAYFVGTFLGKRRLAPEISPKKTWEGFIGGILTAALFGFLLGKGYEWVITIITGELTFKVDVLFLALVAIPCAMLGVLGDLSASILKRECAVKDFGNIMPGHGGVLDRFDSVLFVVPFVYLAFMVHFPITPIV